MVMDNFNKRLEKRLLAIGMTKAQLARQLSVKPQNITHWIKRNRIPMDAAYKASETLGCEVKWLVWGVGSEVDRRDLSMGMVHEETGSWSITDTIKPGAIRRMLPDASPATTFLVAGLLNDLYTGRLSEQDFSLFKPLIQRMKGE